MRRTISAISLIVTITSGSAAAMELNTALRLVRAWGQDGKDLTLVGRMTVDADGNFLTKSAGAFFRYDAEKKQLLVSGLVRYKVKIHSHHPFTWDEMVRASKRESATLGDGQLELYTQQLFSFDPDVVLLTKTFEDEATESGRFVVEVGWLLSAAHYWFVKRYNEVSMTPEDELIKQAPGINERMLKLRPRPW